MLAYAARKSCSLCITPGWLQKRVVEQPIQLEDFYVKRLLNCRGNCRKPFGFIHTAKGDFVQDWVASLFCFHSVDSSLGKAGLECGMRSIVSSEDGSGTLFKLGGLRRAATVPRPQGSVVRATAARRRGLRARQGGCSSWARPCRWAPPTRTPGSAELAHSSTGIAASAGSGLARSPMSEAADMLAQPTMFGHS